MMQTDVQHPWRRRRHRRERGRETSREPLESHALDTPVATVSLGWAIPFMRVTGSSPSELQLLAREGLQPRDFAHPETRVRHRVMMELLKTALSRLKDPQLGLRAGAQLAPGDFETLESACRSCATLRDAILCAGRFMHLVHGAQESRLIEEGDTATWRLRITDDVEQLPAANDFALAAACWFARRYADDRTALREVHFLHTDATNLTEYARVFDGAQVRLGMPYNALVFARSYLDTPMPLAHPGLQAAFQQRASEVLERLRRSESLEGQVRQLILDRLSAGDVSMPAVAQRFAFSVATLRRRLGDEGTSHSELLDQVRRELAQRYLTDRALSISEAAFLLGFSHVTAFYKAFRRWTQGETPAEFRARVLGR